MGQGKKDEAEEVKKQVGAQAAKLEELAEKEKELNEKVIKIMMTIPNIIDPSVPIGKNDEENVEIQKYGDPVVPEFEIPYHTDIIEKLKMAQANRLMKMDFASITDQDLVTITAEDIETPKEKTEEKVIKIGFCA